MRTAPRRAVFAAAVVLVGAAVTALSAALSWGPTHAWAWITLPVRIGFGVGFAFALALLAVPRRGCAALVLLALVVHLSLLNQAPASAYLAHTLQTWEQGRFIRFNGLAQWVGWLWPYLAIVFLVQQIRGGQGKTRI